MGREGVAVDSLDDMRTLFGGIPLGEVSTSMTINSPAAMLLAFYLLVGEEQGVPRARLRGHDSDGHPEGVHRAEGVHLPAGAVDAAGDGHGRVLQRGRCRCGIRSRSRATTSGRRARRRRRSWRSRSRTASPTSSGRSSAGLEIDEFAPRLSFFFNAHLDFFEEIAKYRAARRIWARGVEGAYGAKSERSLLMRFHTQTAGVSLTAQQPEVNIVRTAIEALAAVLGGTQSLHTNSFDEALALPTEDAVRIALRTQQVIAHETGVVNTADPLGGSYYVESLTNELERQAYEYFERIDALGGVVAAIEQNFFQSEIAEASASAISGRSSRSSGSWSASTATSWRTRQQIPILQVDPALEGEQIARVRALRARRDNAAAEAGARRAEAGRGRRDEPDVPDHRRRQGRRDDGRDVRRPPRRLGHLARNARLLTAAPILTAMVGKIRVVVAKPGLDGHDRGAKIIARALRDAGMEVIYTGLHQTPEQIVETAIQEDADAVGISILSGAHMTLVPRILTLLREQGAEDVLVVVGGTIPNDDIAELKQLGVAEVFTPGAATGDIVEFLQGRVPA